MVTREQLEGLKARGMAITDDMLAKAPSAIVPFEEVTGTVPPQSTQGPQPTGPSFFESLQNISPSVAPASAQSVAPQGVPAPQIQPVSAPVPVPAVADAAAPAAPMTLTSDVAPMGAEMQPIAPQGPATGGLDRITRAALKGAEEGAKIAAQNASEIQNTQKAIDELAAARAGAEEEQRKRIEEGSKKLESMMGEFQNEKGVDPSRYWNSRSGWQKASLIIGAALGGMAGEPRLISDMLSKEIDRDIDAQKTDLDKKKAGVTAQTNLLAEMRARFNDEASATAAAKLAKLQSLDLSLKAQAEKAKGVEAKQRGEMLAGEIQAKKDQAMAEFQKAQQVAAARMMLNGSGQQSRTQQLLNALPAEEQKEARERLVLGSGELKIEGLAPTKERAANLSKLVTNNAEALGLVGDIERIGKEVGTELLPSEKAAKAKLIKTVLTGKLRESVVGPGAMTEEEREIISDIIANPTDIMQLDANSTAKLNQLKSIFRNQVARAAESEGLKLQGVANLKPRVTQ